MRACGGCGTSAWKSPSMEVKVRSCGCPGSGERGSMCESSPLLPPGEAVRALLPAPLLLLGRPLQNSCGAWHRRHACMPGAELFRVLH